ncbi:hypothetical protein ORV05_13470 [Amycolatopsis cynarae]|uniref:Beta protein n=1 Tax=Amycolatopsis cynarae TaxID=2995223 RepID=A0ABY7B9A8_9PSEU|nr:hypothetical protein [Amycolatopsis sp. HUAS 11-8]WAL68736.1 hypothetical protein ORV05_13470 [Amycolatopsis sp. HUAS 11-8]
MHSVRPLVVLKCKLGELGALCNLRSGSDAQVRLMIELLDSVKPAGKLLPALARAAVRLAEFGRTLWLDTTWLTPASPLAQRPGGVFEYLDTIIESALLEAHGLFASELPGLIPVVPVTASDDDLRRVRLLLEHKSRDVAIRVHSPWMPEQDLAEHTRRIMRLTSAQTGQVHAILDAGFVEAVHTHHVRAVTRSAAVLSGLLGPGSTTLLAGSIPAIRTTYTTIEHNRTEVSLWREVRHSTPEIRYGDYGVTHPKPPIAGKGGRSPFPFLCYTVPQKIVILRRRLETGDVPAELFADLAEELVERDDFAGPDYSWGDHEFMRCRRRGGRTAGSVPKWVAMATSHHLEHVSRRTATDL